MPYAKIEDRRAWEKTRCTELIKVIEAAKNRPCMDCNGTYHLAAMQFDHVRGIKRWNIARALAQTKRLSVLQEEIDKCDVVCANCHSVRTWERKEERWKRKRIVNPIAGDGTCLENKRA